MLEAIYDVPVVQGQRLIESWNHDYSKHNVADPFSCKENMQESGVRNDLQKFLHLDWHI